MLFGPLFRPTLQVAGVKSRNATRLHRQINYQLPLLLVIPGVLLIIVGNCDLSQAKQSHQDELASYNSEGVALEPGLSQRAKRAPANTSTTEPPETTTTSRTTTSTTNQPKSKTITKLTTIKPKLTKPTPTKKERFYPTPTKQTRFHPTPTRVAKNQNKQAEGNEKQNKSSGDVIDKMQRKEQEAPKIAGQIPLTLQKLRQLQQLVPKAEGGRYEARDVAYFLDSHQAHALHDPRIYFTQQSPMGALVKLRADMAKVPDKLRFAYLMRTFNELGRKIASRMNMYNSQMLALLRKAPDGLGAKPTISAYVDAIKIAFDADEDAEMVNESVGQARFTQKTIQEAARILTSDMKRIKRATIIKTGFNFEPPATRSTISTLIEADKDKAELFDASLNEISIVFARSIVRLMMDSNDQVQMLSKSNDSSKVLDVLSDALKNGAKSMIELMNSNDKFKPEVDAVVHMNHILNKTMSVIKRHVRDNDLSSFGKGQGGDNKDGSEQKIGSRGLRDTTYLVGPWNSYLFDTLGTSERVVRTFASLLSIIQENAMKNRFINTYIAQAKQEFTDTLSGFVALQASPFIDKSSDEYLLNNLNQTLTGSPNKLLKVQAGYDMDKNRLPARCYLAGRRWRLLLSKAMKHYDKKDEIITVFVDKINEIKASVIKVPGNDLQRLCLPRIEVGLKGWGINGEPASAVNAAANKFPLRNPIEGLNKDEDPFTGGARMGYRLGFMIGYNDKRNQSLEMEASRSASRKGTANGQSDNLIVGLNPVATSKSNSEKLSKNSTVSDEKKRNSEIDYLAKASYRRGMTVGARRALEISCHEGYLATLKVSLRAGMLLPLEAGSSLGSLKSANFAGQAGGEAGRTFVNQYLTERDNMDEKLRGQLMNLGESYGSLGGRSIGETIGSIVGHESALEAYRRAVTRGGKMTKAKFHLDEYLAGAIVGFDHGVTEGGRVAQSSNANPSAPKFFKLTKPRFVSKVSAAFGTDPGSKASKATNKTKDNLGASRSGLIELPASLPTVSSSEEASNDHWEQDLITPLSDKNIEDFHKARNHTRVTGTFKGTYNVAKEVKKGLQRVSFANLTYNLEIHAIGFAMNDVTYLSLSGTINNANVLHGSLVARNIVDDGE